MTTRISLVVVYGIEGVESSALQYQLSTALLYSYIILGYPGTW